MLNNLPKFMQQNITLKHQEQICFLHDYQATNLNRKLKQLNVSANHFSVKVFSGSLCSKKL